MAGGFLKKPGRETIVRLLTNGLPVMRPGIKVQIRA